MTIVELEQRDPQIYALLLGAASGDVALAEQLWGIFQRGVQVRTRATAMRWVLDLDYSRHALATCPSQLGAAEKIAEHMRKGHAPVPSKMSWIGDARARRSV